MRQKMMYSITKSIFLILLTTTTLYAQSESCGTPDLTEAQMQALPYYGNNAYLDYYVDSLTNVFNNPANRVDGREEGVWYRVPIQFFVYQWQGQDVITRGGKNMDKTLKAMMHNLNEAMRRNNTKIRFYMLCPRIINNETATTGFLSDNAWLALQYLYVANQPALKCHIVNSVEGGNFYSLQENVIFMEASATTNLILEYGETGVTTESDAANSTFVHEVGHWLGLQHTHLNDGVPCFKEPVSRGIFASVCSLWLPIRHCELKGDFLCDTPADPRLNQHTSDIMEDCSWFTNIRDDRGDFYAPDTRNYMSYSRVQCRKTFTEDQKAVMLLGMNAQISRQNFNFQLTLNNGFDSYEPDNEPRYSSFIDFNIPQIHSFSDVGCNDDDDWIKFNNPDNPQNLPYISDLVLEVESVAGFNFPVLEVEMWDGGFATAYISPDNTTRVTYTQTNIQPTKITYTIPCTLPRGRTYLFRIVRNGNQIGRYQMTLKKANPQLSGDDYIVCLNTPKTYTLTDVPAGATINWQVSDNITILSGQGTNTITAIANGFGNASIRANINGCGRTLRLMGKPILIGVYLPSSLTYLGTPYIGQTVTFRIAKPLPLNVDAYTYQVFVLPQNPNNQYPWSLISYVDTGTEIEMYVRVGMGVAEIGIEVNSCGVISARPNLFLEGIPDPNCYYGLRVFPNPTKDRISLSRFGADPCLGLRTYQGKLYNKFNKIVWQGEIKEGVEIDVKKLPNDVYYLHLTDDKGNTKKEQIIINK